MSSQEIFTLEDRNNPLLNRREIKVIIRDMAGKLNRLDATQLISKQFDIEKQKEIIPISMKCETGRTDVRASFYVYNSLEEAKEQLPRYRLIRNMSKEDRKKIIDEEKAVKLKAKQAAAAESKSGGAGAGGKKK